MTLRRDGAIAEVRLIRPEGGNPVDPALLAELRTATASLHDDAGVHVVLLSAEGDVFASGADVVSDPGHDGVRCLELMGPPVIAVIEGDVSGAGVALALACDIRVAAEAAV